MSFGDRLKEEREAKSISREELAQYLNLSYSTIAKYEIGTRFPDPKTLERLAELLDVSVDYLLGRVDIKKPLIYDALPHNTDFLIFWDLIQQRDDLRLLLEKSEQLTPDAVRKITEVIKLIADKAYNGEDK